MQVRVERCLGRSEPERGSQHIDFFLDFVGTRVVGLRSLFPWIHDVDEYDLIRGDAALFQTGISLGIDRYVEVVSRRETFDIIDPTALVSADVDAAACHANDRILMGRFAAGILADTGTFNTNTSQTADIESFTSKSLRHRRATGIALAEKYDT